MRKRTLARQVEQILLEDAPDKLQALDYAVKAATVKARSLTWLATGGATVIAAVASVVAFYVTMGDDLAEYGSETLGFGLLTWPFMLIVPLVVLIVGLVMTNRRAFAYRLSQMLEDQGVFDQVPRARQLFRAQPFKTMYQATWAVTTIVLVVFGAFWAAMISAGTAGALSMAKDPKAM